MPLKLDLKTGEKLVVNGAVLENVGPNAKVLVHNRASILREKEILATEECATPASRVYFSLQCAYMFPSRQDYYLELFHQYLADYLKACPSAAEIGEAINTAVAKRDLYRGLRETRRLIHHEMNTLAQLPTGIEKILGLADAEQGDERGGSEDPEDPDATLRARATES